MLDEEHKTLAQAITVLRCMAILLVDVKDMPTVGHNVLVFFFLPTLADSNLTVVPLKVTKGH